MSAPSPFDVSRAIGANTAGAFREVRDENAIERILSQASQSGNPRVLQDSMSKILSQVSPERQGPALQYLQNTYANIQKRQEKAKAEADGRKAADDAGVTYGLHPTAQAQQLRNMQPAKPAGGLTGQAVPPQFGQAIAKIIKENPNANADELGVAFDEAGIPTVYSNRYVENRRRTNETGEKIVNADKLENRRETLPLKQSIIQAADISRESIRNKTHLMDIIDRGNIDDPTFAIFAESLPFNLGKRLLSEDTVEYKSGLVDEFGDLKNIFKGATRVKEVEIYENKLADIYLTDSQKKAILKSRINAAKIPIIREEAAAEVESRFPNTSALQFNKKVDEIAKPKMDALFNNIWDEQKSIIDQAEKQKNVALDINDPQDKEIIRQILKEAGGNYLEAEKLAKKKGYKF